MLWNEKREDPLGSVISVYKWFLQYYIVCVCVCTHTYTYTYLYIYGFCMGCFYIQAQLLQKNYN